MSNEMDRGRVETLTGVLLVVINDYYKSGPSSPMQVFEVLNALSMAAGSVLAATDNAAVVRDFFDDCLEQQIAFFLAEKHKMEEPH